MKLIFLRNPPLILLKDVYENFLLQPLQILLKILFQNLLLHKKYLIFFLNLLPFHLKFLNQIPLRVL